MVERLHELAYISAAKVAFAPAELRALLERARLKNQRLGVTGVLVYAEGSFMQMIEGPEEVVQSLFATIERDPRHHNVVRMFGGPTAGRSFEAWTMGFVEATPTLPPMPGFNDFLQKGFANTQPTPALDSRIRDLALQFRMGRWRQYVQTT